MFTLCVVDQVEGIGVLQDPYIILPCAIDFALPSSASLIRRQSGVHAQGDIF
jgi:hypothetical protein